MSSSDDLGDDLGGGMDDDMARDMGLAGDEDYNVAQSGMNLLLHMDRIGQDQAPDWTRECGLCGESPVVPITSMCGPCTFGDADTAGGNW